MNSNMRKSTIREIGKSLGRYLAIMAITALGVGFFGGLKICKSAMLNTGDQYLTDTLCYDFDLMNSYGFEEKDVQGFLALPEVAAAEGSYTMDMIYIWNEEQRVAKLHSITDTVNQLVLVEGRMPENELECVVDSDAFTSADLGTQFVLSGLNDSDNLENLNSRSYTIVGLVQSPVYLNFNRGTTSLGDGSVSGFVYLPKEAFTNDIYSEIFVRLAKHEYIYSDEYNDYVEALTDTMEDATNEAALRRYDVVISDANEELTDASAELEDAKEEGAESLADAYEELKDGQVEIGDGFQEIMDAEQELQEAEWEITSNEEELADAKEEIAEGETEIADGWQEVADGEAELADAAEQLADAREQITEGEEELEDARYQIANGFYELSVKEEELADAQDELDANGSQVSAGMGMLQNGAAQVEQAIIQYDSLTTAYQYAMAIGDTTAAAGYQAYLAQIPPREILVGQQQRLTGDYNYLYDQYLLCLDAQRQINNGGTAICQARGELLQAQAQADEAEQELINARCEYADGIAEYEDGVAQLEEAKQELTDAEAKLADARAEVADGEQQLADARIEVEDGWQELEDARTEWVDGQYELERGFREYYTAKAYYEKEIADAEIEICDAEAEIADLKEPDTYVLNRESNVGIVSFQNDTSIVEAVAVVFPVFFFLVVALVCITTMNRMIEEQRTQIGVLKAMGYSTATIMAKYLFYSGSAALIGGIAGYFLGIIVFPKTIWGGYSIMYGFADVKFTFDPVLGILSLFAALVCTMGATYLTCKKELTSMPAELIRPRAPKAGKRILLEYLPVIWKRVPFLHKVSIRNLFRYKRRFFMMVVGIGGCTALLLTGFGFLDSISGIVRQQYDEIETYDMSLMYGNPITPQDEAHLQELEGIADYSVFYEASLDARTDTAVKTVSLVIPRDADTITDYVNMRDDHGNAVSLPGDGEVVITNKIAEKLNLSVGDTLTLRDSDMVEMTLTVSGIFKNFIYNYVYINPQTYQTCYGHEPEYKTVYANATNPDAVHETGAHLLDVDEIVSVRVNEDIKDMMDKTMSSLNYIVLLIIVCAALLAFIVLYNLTNINITERIREIATIKVLGFYPMETAVYVFRENMILSVIGGVVGLILGRYLHAFVIYKIDIDMVCFENRILPASYIYSILLTMVFALIVNFFMYFKLNRIDMAESLKSIE